MPWKVWIAMDYAFVAYHTNNKILRWCHPIDGANHLRILMGPSMVSYNSSTFHNNLYLPSNITQIWIQGFPSWWWWWWWYDDNVSGQKQTPYLVNPLIPLVFKCSMFPNLVSQLFLSLNFGFQTLIFKGCWTCGLNLILIQSTYNHQEHLQGQTNLGLIVNIINMIYWPSI
jgi:hypothetical protein